MAKNTNPLTKNIQIKQNWGTIGLPVAGRVTHGSNELVRDEFIKNLINGSFMKQGMLTSEVGISKRSTGENTISWQFYPLSPTMSGNKGGEEGVKVVELVKLLKKIIDLKEPKNEYKLICVRAGSKFTEGKILNDYISIMVGEDANRLKNIVGGVIREYRSWAQGSKGKKYDSIINKSKNSR